MKTEERMRKEIKELESDLKHWRKKLDAEKDSTRRHIIGNTICGIEAQIETLRWVLEE